MTTSAIQIPEGEFAAYIFDCDGTLADTMPLHYRAWQRLLREEGGDFPEDLFYSWGGRPPSEIVPDLAKHYGFTLDLHEAVERKENYYLELLDEAQPIEPVIAIARAMHGKLPLAVASGGPRDVVMQTLGKIGVTEIFDVIVGAEDYARGKPAPDPFLETARRLGVPPESCLVFEDTVTGEQAARAAGMACVIV